MKKQQVLDKLERSWVEFKTSYQGLAAEQMQKPGAAGDWSVKDILAHVSGWEEEALKYLPLILRGGRPPRYSVMYGGIDAFNDQMASQKRDNPVAEVLQQLELTHRRLMEYIQQVPEEQFARETRFRRRLRLDTYSHYPVHTQAIRSWRERQN